MFESVPILNLNASVCRLDDQMNVNSESKDFDDGDETWRDTKVARRQANNFKIRTHILEAFVDKILADERFNIGE